jgi:hypothetical protein
MSPEGWNGAEATNALSAEEERKAEYMIAK